MIVERCISKEGKLIALEEELPQGLHPPVKAEEKEKSFAHI